MGPGGRLENVQPSLGIRGGACCVALPGRGHLGIAHFKWVNTSRGEPGYLQVFYEKNGTPPYAIRAISAPFCFGQRCPLQIATGIAPYPPNGSPESVVIAYGERDCDGR